MISWRKVFIRNAKKSVLRIYLITVRVLGVSYLVRILSAADSKWPLDPQMRVG